MRPIEAIEVAESQLFRMLNEHDNFLYLEVGGMGVGTFDLAVKMLAILGNNLS